MKTRGSILVLLCLVLGIVACGPREAAPAQDAGKPAETSAPVVASTPAPPAPAAKSPPQDGAAIDSFEKCAADGNPVMESYPQQCRTKDGRTFTEDVGNRVEKQGLIQVDEPTPNQKIASPLTIHGKARGPWYFEASFPVKLRDAGGATLAEGIVQADGEWMTEDFVPFKVTLTFTPPPAGTKGSLVLIKSNASGLPEHDDQLVIPVKF